MALIKKFAQNLDEAYYEEIDTIKEKELILLRINLEHYKNLVKELTALIAKKETQK